MDGRRSGSGRMPTSKQIVDAVQVINRVLEADLLDKRVLTIPERVTIMEARNILRTLTKKEGP